MSEEEKGLLLLAKSKDVEALETLATTAFLKVPPWLKSRFYRLPYEDMEDAVSEALIKFLEHPFDVQADSIASFIAWIKKVASSSIIDKLRSFSQKAVVPLIDVASEDKYEDEIEKKGCKNKGNWTIKYFSPYRGSMHPIRHILIINYLGINPEKLFDKVYQL